MVELIPPKPPSGHWPISRFFSRLRVEHCYHLVIVVTLLERGGDWMAVLVLLRCKRGESDTKYWWQLYVRHCQLNIFCQLIMLMINLACIPCPVSKKVFKTGTQYGIQRIGLVSLCELSQLSQSEFSEIVFDGALLHHGISPCKSRFQ
jgi:hypothetical protein